MAFIIIGILIPYTVLPVVNMYMGAEKDMVKIAQNTFRPFEVMLIPPKLISLYK